MNEQAPLLPSDVELPKAKRRRRGIRCRTIDEQHLTSRDIYPPDEFRQIAAHDVDVHGKTLGDEVMYLDLRVTAGPKRGDNARMTIWAELPRWLRWTRIRAVLRVRVERDY